MASRAILALLLALIFALPAAAQSEKKAPAKKEPVKKEAVSPANDPVIAKVNGTELRRSDLETLLETYPPQIRQQPMDKLYPRLVDQLVSMTLMAQQARKQKLNDDPRVKKMITLADDNVLQDALMAGVMKQEVTEAKVRARYDQYAKNAMPQDEVHARHILVKSEAEADDIIKQLNKGADFAKLAAEKTTDPAGKTSGGDLGYFRQTDMVPEFAAAAFALKPGEFTQKPVKTQFGWHVIKVEDRRKGQVPSYEQIAPQLAQQMERELYEQKVKEIAASAKIEVFNGDGTKPAPPTTAPPALAPSAAAPALPNLQGLPELPGTGGPPKLAPATENLGK